MRTAGENLKPKTVGTKSESGYVPGGPEIRNYVCPNLLAVFIHGMNQAHGRLPIAGHGLRYIKVGECTE